MRFFNKDQHHDSYTIIFYIEDMKECISVIIGSHNINNAKKNYKTSFYSDSEFYNLKNL
jgi:hypothetical protein